MVIETPDIQQTFDAGNDAGLIVRSSIEEGDFGNKEFSVKDYDGNTIFLCSHVSFF